ncbi:hypothetical protein [Corynebacterium phocae]|uniref:hypothetical protein n=1 Tax=Corynebacterium phocae TaxID=161895 RepID=UPI000950D2D5|nr:hypothetical protein [Corynebacterium phocae]KAA8723207.1 hypothetical protein F4V58_07795 [Corynebacterium phocae]
MWRIDLEAFTGQQWELLGRGCTGGVTVRVDGLPGFSAIRSASTFSTTERSGVRLIPGRSVVQPSEGVMMVGVRPTRDKTAEELLRDFYGAFSAERYSTLVVTSPEGVEYRSKVRLPDGQGLPDVSSLGAPFIQVGIPLVRDVSTWQRDYSKPGGRVTITNSGADLIYPTVRWTTGGEVIVPSGARFTLPTVEQSRRLNLDPAAFYAVTDDNGDMDEALWRSMFGEVLGEMVPPGESRTFTAPAGSSFLWSIGVDTPWAL